MDQRGTSYAITDGNGNILTNYTMDAFGRQLASPTGTDPNVPNELVYQTNWRTVTIGGRLYGISKYRLYDFELGIFISQDFLRFLNKYRAFQNNPVDEFDVLGLITYNECYRACVGQTLALTQGFSMRSAIEKSCASNCAKYQAGDYGDGGIPSLPKELKDYYDKVGAEYIDEPEAIGPNSTTVDDYNAFWGSVNDLKDVPCVEVVVRRGITATIVNAALKNCDYIFIEAHGGPGDAKTNPGIETIGGKEPDWSIKNPNNPNRCINVGSCYGQNVADFINKFGGGTTTAPAGSKDKEILQSKSLKDVTEKLKNLKDKCCQTPDKKVRVCIIIGLRQHTR